MVGKCQYGMIAFSHNEFSSATDPGSPLRAGPGLWRISTLAREWRVDVARFVPVRNGRRA